MTTETILSDLAKPGRRSKRFAIGVLVLVFLFALSAAALWLRSDPALLLAGLGNLSTFGAVIVGAYSYEGAKVKVAALQDRTDK